MVKAKSIDDFKNLLDGALKDSRSNEVTTETDDERILEAADAYILYYLNNKYDNGSSLNLTTYSIESCQSYP